MPQIVVGAGFVAWAVAVVAVAHPRPQLGRALLAALFLLMGLVNVVTAFTDPGVYQEAYGTTAWVPAYRDLINGFWAQHDALLVLLVGVVQMLMGTAVLAGGWPRRAGLLAMIAFLVLVAPTAPQNLVNLAFAAGAVLVLRVERPPRPAGRGDDLAFAALQEPAESLR